MTAAHRMPDWLEPMAATLTQERFSGRDWLFERKFDGIRLLAFRLGADVQLLSRNRLPQKCPAIAEAVAGLPLRDAILDGELTWSAAGAVYHVTGKQFRNRFMGYEVFQSNRRLRGDLKRCGMRIVTEMPDSNRLSPSFVCEKV